MASSTFLLFLLSLVIPFSSSQQDFHDCLSSNQTPETFVTRNDAGFTSLLNSRAINLKFTTGSIPKPNAIFTPLNEKHVQAAVVCAKKLGVRLRFRSGGHDYEGISYRSVADNSPFVVIDMSKMRSINVDVTGNTVWAEAGATIGEVYYRVAEKSRTVGVPMGVCTSLGIGGMVTGGGYGSLLRKYGIAADNAVDAKIVNANGRILDRKTMGEDVFWAIRGGGGGSFGVILAWKLKLVPVPATVTVFNVPRTLEQGATKIFAKWQQVGHKFDKDLFVRVVIQASNKPGTSDRTVSTTYNALYLGGADRLVENVSRDFPELGLRKEDCTEMSWLESVLFIGAYPKNTPTSVLLGGKPAFLNSFIGKSDFVKTPIPESGLEGIWKIMVEDKSPMMILNPYGGKMSEIPESSIPFPHRNGVIFNIQYFSSWNEPQASNDHVNVIRKLYDYMGRYVSMNPREAYVNYRDLDLGMTNRNGGDNSWGISYFKNNFQRLVKIKTKFDPDNFFSHEQSIPVLKK